MRKSEELSNPKSCLNKAKDDELLFVLLARDKAAPYVVRMWTNERVRLGLNAGDDAQIREAQEWAMKVEFGHEVK
jgi:hypothetical protein